MPERLPPRGPRPGEPTRDEPQRDEPTRPGAAPRLEPPRPAGPPRFEPLQAREPPRFEREPLRPEPPRPDVRQFDLFGGPRRPQERIYSVTELTREVKGVLEGRFGSLIVEGEVSNLRQPSSGHLYFTLKDEGACIDAVLFRNEARRLKFGVQNGMKLLARGRITLYEPQGRYQVLCDSVEPLGAGALQVAFEQLKARLEAEGLFARARKRALPYLPKRIAVVTSPSGAAIHDFLRVLHRRYPGLPVLIVPARVQGDGAAGEIARAIARAAAAPRVDVVVVTRGGGSLEDLWPFNEEVVARALARCPVPTVSAVGHEVDFTIADFVADVRAPTPTAAAELLAKVKEELGADLVQRRARLLRAFRTQQAARKAQLEAKQARVADPRRLIGERRLRLDRLQQRLEDRIAESIRARAAALRALRERLSAEHPREHLHRLHREVARLEERLAALARRALTARRHRFEGLAGRLDALSPLRVLARGYAVAFDGHGHALRDPAEIKPGELVRVRLHGGQLEARVLSATPEKSDRLPD